MTMRYQPTFPGRNMMTLGTTAIMRSSRDIIPNASNGLHISRIVSIIVELSMTCHLSVINVRREAMQQCHYYVGKLS